MGDEYEAEIVREGGRAWIGCQAIAGRTVDSMLGSLAITHTGGEIGQAGHLERYSANETGRALLANPAIEPDLQRMLLAGLPFTIIDGAVVPMEEEPCA